MSFRTRPSMAQHRLAIKNRQSQQFLTLDATTHPTSRRVRFSLPSLSKRGIAHAARVLAPTLVALTFASAAHAQGTMDFSGAQTLMGTFNWRNDYVAVEQWSRNIVRNQYVHLVALHDQHVHFAKTWDNNLRLQGFAEAFSGKCILG